MSLHASDMFLSPQPICVSSGPSPASQDCTPSIYQKAKRASMDPDAESPAARVLPWKVHTPTGLEDKENSVNQETKPPSGRKSFGEAKPPHLRRQIAQKPPPAAPPPTSEKSAPPKGFLDRVASEVLRKTLNFAAPADKNALALRQVSAKLEEEVRAQKDYEASSMEGDMRKVPIVNEDLAAKLARRRDWEAEEEAKTRAAKAAAQLLENERQAKLQQDAQERERRAQEERQRERERQMQQEMEMQMEQSMQRIALDAAKARQEREARELEAGSKAQEDEEIQHLLAARQAADAAAQLASLERQEIDRRISAREVEKERLRRERQRLEDEVRRAAAEAESAQFRESRVEKIMMPLEKPHSSVHDRSKPSSPVQLDVKCSDLMSLPIVSTSSSAKPDKNQEAAAGSEESRQLKIDGRLSDILSGIDKLLRGDKLLRRETIVDQAEKKTRSTRDSQTSEKSVVEDSVDLEKTREFWGARDSSSMSGTKAAESKMYSSQNANKSQALDKTDLVGTPHHKMLLRNDLAFATPGTTSTLVNDWCRSLEVKTRPVPREEVNSEEAVPNPPPLDDPDHVSSQNEEEYVLRRAPRRTAMTRAANPSHAQQLADSDATVRALDVGHPRLHDAKAVRAPELLARGSSSDNVPIPCSDYEAEEQILNQKHAKTRASQLDMVYQELESATQMALETAFNDKADLHELQIACNKLSAMISEYEHIKGQAFSDTHSYIRLKKRLADRIRVVTTEMEQMRSEYERLPRESSFKSWANMPMSSPRSPSFDVPRVGLRIAHKGSGHVVIVELIPGTPAEMSGQLLSGDIIEQADGQTLMGMYMADVVSLISGGPKSSGSFVCLRLLRDSSARITVRILRQDKMEIVPKPQPSVRPQGVPPLRLDAATLGPSQQIYGPPPPPRPTNSARAPPLPSRPGSLSNRQAPAPPLPPRPQNMQPGPAGAGHQGISAGSSMRAWMNQPTAPVGSQSNMGIANPHAPRLLPAGGASVPRRQSQDGGWFNGGFFGIAGLGGVTQNILQGNVSTILKDLSQNAQTDRHRQQDSKAGARGAAGGLPYERYQQAKLTYERKPAIAYQPAFNNHACPDSPGSLHARLHGGRARSDNEHKTGHLQDHGRPSSHPGFVHANDAYPDGSSGMLM